MDYHVTPLFSSPLITVTLDQDMGALNNFYKEFEFERINSESAKNTYITKSLSVLNHFPEETQTFKEIFHHFTKNFLGYKNVEFDITTSWGTQVLTGGYSHDHIHSNCLYSSIFYFNTIPENEGGQLELVNQDYPHRLINLGNPSHANEYNMDSWRVVPRKNLFVIFPQYLTHKITTYTGKETRNSLVMNWMPFGRLGMSDSSINMSLTPL